MHTNHRTHRPFVALSLLGALHAGCGGSDDEGGEKPGGGAVDAGTVDMEVQRVSDACKDAEENDCYAANGLVGTWKCVTDEITVTPNGQITLRSGDGQRAAGCITCDGTFQAESTADSAGTPSVFSIVDGTLASSDAETSEASWEFCNEVPDADSCTRAPERGAETARCYLEPEADPGDAPRPPANGQEVEVLIAERWTPTMIGVAAGDSVTIYGEGEINWYSGQCETCTSTPVGSGCPVDDSRFLVQGIRCWSLVAKVGEAGEPFYVGTSTTFEASEDGELYLGVNDDNFVDNTGAWTATVSVQSGS